MSEQQSNPSVSSPIVLMVEDDVFLKRLLIEKLGQDGFNVLDAGNGAEAHIRLSQQLPSIILLDLMMPNTDGFQLLQEIKSNSATAGIPVVVLSNLSEKENVDRAMSLGAADYIVKAQFSPEEIIARIKKILGQ